MAAEGRQVVVVGLGYIGLPTAALIASSDFSVLGVDIRQDVADTVNSGRIHIEEVDLEGLVRAVVDRGALRASVTPEPADIFVIAVPTPHDETHAPDIGHVLSAARAIAPVLRPGNLVILESTSPVGTTDEICRVLAEMRPDLAVPGQVSGEPDIHVAYCPERVLPGRILIELVDNDRCIGGVTSRCAEAAAAFYAAFVKGDCIVTSARTAEMVKLVENSFRDVNIAFANELSMVAERADIDVWEVIRLANRHPRVDILQPGPGVGGHCIAVDPWFLVHSDREYTPLIRNAREVNDRKTEFVIDRAASLIDGRPGAQIACFGLAFKPNIDDFRESPAVKVVEALAARYGGRIQVVEPHTDTLPPEIATHGAQLVETERALRGCDILLMLVDHKSFKDLPTESRAGKIVYDTRGIWPDAIRGRLSASR